MASPSLWVSRSTASLGPAARRQPGVQCEDSWNGRENQTGLQIDQEYLANWNEKETDCLPTSKNSRGELKARVCVVVMEIEIEDDNTEGAAGVPR